MKNFLVIGELSETRLLIRAERKLVEDAHVIFHSHGTWVARIDLESVASIEEITDEQAHAIAASDRAKLTETQS